MAKKKYGRNDPCWCGSGKKYKKCHLERENQERDNPWASVESNKKNFHAKKCFAKDGPLGECKGQIIKAHTVSRGPNLNKISSDGKVVHYRADMAEMSKNGGKLTASEIGTRKASTFFGFCKEHDRILFSCIENEDFVGNPEQCLAIAYRTLSRELYGKDASSPIRDILRNADKGTTLHEQFRTQDWLNNLNFGNEASRKELRSTHGKLTQALASGNNELLCSIVIEFDGEIPFMFAGAWSPFSDLFGRQLQQEFPIILAEQIFLSSFTNKNKSQICISWIAIPEAPGQTIGNQIVALPNEQQAEACLQLAAKYMENIFYSPKWFNSLNQNQRRQMNALANSGIDAFGSEPEHDIRFDLSYALPKATGYFIQNTLQPNSPKPT